MLYAKQILDYHVNSLFWMGGRVQQRAKLKCD